MARAGSPAKSLQGTWTPTSKLPGHVDKVPENPNFASLKAFIPPPPGSTASYPAVYYSATPAEIVVFGGQPQWTAIPGTQLSYASNTGSPVFKYAPTGAYYFLTSGRWFTTTTPLAGAVDVRDLQPAARFRQDSSQQSRRAACWRRCRERRKPKTPC